MVGSGCTAGQFPASIPLPSPTAAPTLPPSEPAASPSPRPTANPPPTLPSTAAAAPTATPTWTAAPTLPATATTAPAVPPPTATAAPAYAPLPPAGRAFAPLAAFWDGSAEWFLELYDVGLPVGESDTVDRGGGEFWSYLHASHLSAGVVDQCGDPVPFPGCVTLWRSWDGGASFALENPVCLFPCRSCPCDPARDHTHQQQYPRVALAGGRWVMVYEWGAGTYLRTSSDGVRWSGEVHVPGTGQWNAEPGTCPPGASIGEHPHIYDETEYGNCLVGAPPGIYLAGETLYVFVGLGRDPGHMGCYVGAASGGGLSHCAANPILTGAAEYGPLDALGAAANPYFDFRTISSADVVCEGAWCYMFYEGVRGPSSPTVVDDQFGLGLARSPAPTVDGQWEKYPRNPIILDLPGNVGVGHADVVVGPATYLYTATSPGTRGRYVLVYK